MKYQIIGKKNGNKRYYGTIDYNLSSGYIQIIRIRLCTKNSKVLRDRNRVLFNEIVTTLNKFYTLENLNTYRIRTVKMPKGKND